MSEHVHYWTWGEDQKVNPCPCGEPPPAHLTKAATILDWKQRAEAAEAKCEELRKESDGYFTRLTEAQNYAAAIAQGIDHYPHADGEPCVRCENERLRDIGGRMSNLCFNMSQPAWMVTPHDRMRCDELRREWDAALDEVRKAKP